MREIKFRGKAKDGRWVEGVPIKNGFGKLTFMCAAITDNLSYPMEKIHNFCIEVVPETVTQHTGLKDVNGVEIYEGDIVEQSFTELGSTDGIFDNPPDDMTSFIGEIKMYDGAWWIDSGSWAIPLFRELNPNEVIGNRYENPELMED